MLDIRYYMIKSTVQQANSACGSDVPPSPKVELWIFT